MARKVLPGVRAAVLQVQAAIDQAMTDLCPVAKCQVYDLIDDTVHAEWLRARVERRITDGGDDNAWAEGE